METAAEARRAVERATLKILSRVEALLDEGTTGAQELERLCNVMKGSAAVLGVRTLLDDQEQRAKIDTMLARLAGEQPHAPEPITVCFEGDAEEFSR